MNDENNATGEHITVRAGDGDAQAYLARPAADPGRSEHPGVLLFMDAIGLRPQIEKMARRIASWGYVVLAPNLFYREGTTAETTPAEPLLDEHSRAAFFEHAMPRVHRLTDDKLARDIEAYLTALHGMSGVAASPVGITGYCMGGRLALLAAAEKPDDIGAVALFHTGGLVNDTPQSPHLRVAQVSAELLAYTPTTTARCRPKRSRSSSTP